MTHVLTFTMQKGGVGKTTTALNVGVNLAQRGARVLLIDIDPQANLTSGLGIDPDSVEHSVYEVLLNPDQGTVQETLTIDAGVDLVPATLDLAGAEMALAGRVGRELLLREALQQTRQQYDYVLIDTPPNLGLFTLNALAAADAVIVPLQLHTYAYKALPKLEQTIDLVRKLNRSLAIGGIVCTIADLRTRISQAVEAEARATYGDLVFRTVIPHNIKLVEAPAVGEPISVYAPQSTGAQAYRGLTDEMEARYAWR